MRLAPIELVAIHRFLNKYLHKLLTQVIYCIIKFSIATLLLTQKSFSILNSALFGSLITNFFLCAFLGITMKQIWGLINTLQILVLILNLNVEIPANLEICLGILSDIANLKLIPQSLVDYFLSKLNLINSTLSNELNNDDDIF